MALSFRVKGSGQLDSSITFLFEASLQNALKNGLQTPYSNHGEGI